MAPVISYTLPAIQLVFNIVIPGTPSTNITVLYPELALNQSENLNVSTTEISVGLPLSVTPTSDTAVTESLKVKVKILPDGYEKFPELGVAFKYHRNETLRWRDAAKKCVEEGGNLVVTDSQRKFEVVQSLLSSGDKVHVGITRMYESHEWVDFRTGSPVLNIPWDAGEPNGIGYCARMEKHIPGLKNYLCADDRYFVCEIYN